MVEDHKPQLVKSNANEFSLLYCLLDVYGTKVWKRLASEYINNMLIKSKSKSK
jgi:hypothetical protein